MLNLVQLFVIPDILRIARAKASVGNLPEGADSGWITVLVPVKGERPILLPVGNIGFE